MNDAKSDMLMVIHIDNLSFRGLFLAQVIKSTNEFPNISVLDK